MSIVYCIKLIGATTKVTGLFTQRPDGKYDGYVGYDTKPWTGDINRVHAEVEKRRITVLNVFEREMVEEYVL